MELPIYNQSGQATGGKAALNPKIFGLAGKNPYLIHQVAVAVLANARRSTASTKTRGEVRGGGKKPWRQKGTGRARHGSIRSPLWRGGGVTFGPTPERNYRQKVNRQSRRLGLFSVLSERVKSGQVLVAEDWDAPGGKTREAQDVLSALAKLKPSKRTLFIVPAPLPQLKRATANLKHVRLNQANNLSILDLLWADSLVIFKKSLPVLETTYLKN